MKARFLQANDVILGLNDKQVNKLRDLPDSRLSVSGANTKVVVSRNQKEGKKRVELEDKK